VTNGVLVNDVIDVTHCLIVLYPSAIRQLQLTLLEQFLHLFLLIARQILIPILEEHHLRHEIFSLSVTGKRLEHRVENGLGVALVHRVEKSSRTEIDTLEVIISIKPKSIEMGVKGHQKFLRILGAIRSYVVGKEGE
jgi:hypothetical protein